MSTESGVPTSPAPPRAITISASYGAGGSEVGPLLAQRLQVPFLDRAIPREVSDRLAVPIEEALACEEPPAWAMTRLLSQLAPAALAVYGGPALPEFVGGDESFRIETERVLHQHAARGAIILGRGAAAVLRDVPHAMHVRLDGPEEARVRQAMGLERIARDEAETRMSRADLSREAYVRHWYHIDPEDPRLYHLVIDSTFFPLEGCVDLIARAAELRAAIR
jgi:cytidylate kinase